jgi:MHS family proline/betaine transporter-like MFS transporter
MALPTFCLGLLPSYDSVGLVSTALLILCRVVQGFSVGGQLMSSIVFSLEGTDESSWGMRTAFVLFATMLGAVVGSLISYILREVLSEEDLISYGWR